MGNVEEGNDSNKRQFQRCAFKIDEEELSSGTSDPDQRFILTFNASAS